MTGGNCSASLDGVGSTESLSTVRNGSDFIVNKAANVDVPCYSIYQTFVALVT